MRLLVRPGVRIKSQARIFKGRRQRTEQTESPGGHRFELLKNSSIFEVKNGPYAGDFDKERFEHKKESADATGM